MLKLLASLEVEIDMKCFWCAESKCHELAHLLKAQGIRAQVDDRQNYTAGWKFNWWELKGVPVRLEVGPQDLARESCCLVRRLDGARKDVSQSHVLSAVTAELGEIHSDMLAKATKERDDGIKQVTDWSEVMPLLKQKKLILAPWCETAESEIQMKHRTKEAMEDGAALGAHICKPVQHLASQYLLDPNLSTLLEDAKMVRE
eukprot:s159_g6.t1